MIRRGDVVIVNFPFTDQPRSKVRPAVVVQNDADNQKIRKTVVAMITGNLKRKGLPSHVYVDPSDPTGVSAGLSFPSLISCNNLYTVEQDSVTHVLGHLSDPLKQMLGAALRAVLGL
jgi:mRNA interferase MazF